MPADGNQNQDIQEKLKKLMGDIKSLQKETDNKAFDAINEVYSKANGFLEEAGNAVGPAKDVIEAMSKMKFSLAKLYGNIAKGQSKKRYIKIDPPKEGKMKAVLDKAEKAAKALGQKAMSQVIEGVNIHGPKQKLIKIYYDKGGNITVTADDGKILIELDKTHGEKTVHMDKDGVHIVSKAGGNSFFDVTTEDVKIKVDKETVSVEAKQKIELKSVESDIHLMAPKGKIFLESKEIQTKSEKDTKMESQQNFASTVKRNYTVTVEKDIEVKSTGMTSIEATKDLNLRTQKDMEIKATTKINLMARTFDARVTSGKMKGTNLGLEADGPLAEKGNPIRLN